MRMEMKSRDRWPGQVTLTNRLGQKASYHYNGKTGVFNITEFSGRKSTIYYFMRRYDKLSGNVVRIRDMAGNDLNFSYNELGEVELITRRGAEQDDPEPVVGFRYDSRRNPTEIMRLNAEGRAVASTSIHYNDANQPQRISDGRTWCATTGLVW